MERSILTKRQRCGRKGTWVLKLLGVLFVLYISLTIAIQAGYYEAKLGEKTTITEEAIKQFEEDVRSGKDVDIKVTPSDTTRASKGFTDIHIDIL